MTTRNIDIGPVGELIRVYEESWRRNHDEVKECWQFEDRLAVVLSLFDLVHNAHRSWRDGVVTGQRPHRAGDEGLYQEQYRRWLHLSESFLPPLEAFEEKYRVVEGGRELRQYRREARDILEGWQSPVPPLTAHTDRPMTHAQLADQLRRLTRPVTQASVPLDNPPDPDTLT
jgi:hypothetical protein